MWRVYKHTGKDQDDDAYKEALNAAILQTKLESLSEILSTNQHNRDGVNASFRRFRWRSMAGTCFIQINTRAGDSVFTIVMGVFAYKKMSKPN